MGDRAKETENRKFHKRWVNFAWWVGSVRRSVLFRIQIWWWWCQDRFEWWTRMMRSGGRALEEELVRTLRFGVIIRRTFTIAGSSNSWIWKMFFRWRGSGFSCLKTRILFWSQVTALFCWSRRLWFPWFVVFLTTLRLLFRTIRTFGNQMLDRFTLMTFLRLGPLIALCSDMICKLSTVITSKTWREQKREREESSSERENIHYSLHMGKCGTRLNIKFFVC